MPIRWNLQPAVTLESLQPCLQNSLWLWKLPGVTPKLSNLSLPADASALTSSQEQLAFSVRAHTASWLELTRRGNQSLKRFRKVPGKIELVRKWSGWKHPNLVHQLWTTHPSLLCTAFHRKAHSWESSVLGMGGWERGPYGVAVFSPSPPSAQTTWQRAWRYSRVWEGAGGCSLVSGKSLTSTSTLLRLSIADEGM